MAPRSCACRSLCINTPVDPARELNELADAQGPARRSNIGSDKAPTKFLIPPEALTPPYVPPISENLFTIFIKVFMKITQAQTRDLLEPGERSLKAKTPDTYFKKLHMDCYHFCQQYEDYFETLSAKEMNCTPFDATFLYGTVSLKWA